MEEDKPLPKRLSTNKPQQNKKNYMKEKKMRLLQAIPSKSERADPIQQACKNCDTRATLSSPSPPSSLPALPFFLPSFLLSHAARNSRSKPPNPNFGTYRLSFSFGKVEQSCIPFNNHSCEDSQN
jgi:hypothetical protein